MPSFHEVFAQAAGTGGTLPFDRFCELALYHPKVGYYRRDRVRVGRGPGTDFHTSTSSDPVFGTLVAAACANLVGTEAAREHAFVEIGAEPFDSAQGGRGAGVLDGIAHAFREVRTIRVGEPLQIEGSCVVFSNELFDAQPFLRLLFRDGAWRELGVRLADGALAVVEMPRPGLAAGELIERLPADPGEGYSLDISLAASRLAAQIAAQPWHGLFVAFDYGRSWRELTEDSPAGTARAYRAHRQHNDLLADPGEQDLTCHVCWDEIIAAVARRGLRDATIESQEAFFIRHARDAVEALVTGAPRGPDPRRLQLQQLIHPTLMGQKFQVLTARRRV
ncbi:MAG TPA: SAM-dependent methyltransferase [Opitutaceae bacterium]